MPRRRCCCNNTPVVGCDKCSNLEHMDISIYTGGVDYGVPEYTTLDFVGQSGSGGWCSYADSCLFGKSGILSDDCIGSGLSQTLTDRLAIAVVLREFGGGVNSTALGLFRYVSSNFPGDDLCDIIDHATDSYDPNNPISQNITNSTMTGFWCGCSELASSTFPWYGGICGFPLNVSFSWYYAASVGSCSQCGGGAAPDTVTLTGGAAGNLVLDSIHPGYPSWSATDQCQFGVATYSYTEIPGQDKKLDISNRGTSFHTLTWGENDCAYPLSGTLSSVSQDACLAQSMAESNCYDGGFAGWLCDYTAAVVK